MKTARPLLLLLCLSTSALTLPVQAQDVPPAVQAMLDNMARQANSRPSYAKLEQEADGTVKIGGLALAMKTPTGEPAATVTVDNVVLSGIADRGEGLYQIGSAKFSNVRLEMKNPEFSASVALPEGAAEDWYIKAIAADATPLEQVRGSMNVARKMSTGPMKIEIMGQPVTIDNYEQTWEGDPRSGAGTYGLKVTNIAIPEQVAALADQGGMLKQLGYAGLTFDVDSTSKLAIDAQNIGFDFDIGLSGRDIGKITIAGAAADIPVAAYAELQRASSSGQQPNFAALMPQIQNISISSASVRFEDSSITKRLMPLLAAAQGMDEATLVNTAGAMVQIGMMQLQSPQLAEQAASAVNAYMKEPKSITIAAKPAAPVKVSEMMALDPTKPQDAVARFGVTVTAND